MMLKPCFPFREGFVTVPNEFTFSGRLGTRLKRAEKSCAPIDAKEAKDDEDSKYAESYDVMPCAVRFY